MLYRVNFDLNPGKELDIFRQRLINNSDQVANVSINNITVSELIKGIKWLQSVSKDLIAQGVLNDTGNSGLVDFEVYENIKGVGIRRHLITNDYEHVIDKSPKLIDSKVQNRNSPYYIDAEIDPKHIFRSRKPISTDEVMKFSDAIVGMATLGHTTLGFIESKNSLHETLL